MLFDRIRSWNKYDGNQNMKKSNDFVSVSVLYIHIDIHHSSNFDYNRYERQLYDLIDGLYLDKSSGRSETIIHPLGLTYSDIQRSLLNNINSLFHLIV